MARVKVWNDNIYPHTEKFKGKMLTIEPGEFIEMDWEEAVEFRGQYTPVFLRGDNTHDPKSFKMIRVEQPTQPVVAEALVNHADGKSYATKEELLAAIRESSGMRHPDAMKSTEAQDSRVANLEQQVAELKAMLERKSPGRPRKEA